MPAAAHLSAQTGEDFLRTGLPTASEVISVAPIEVLVYLKLKSPRAKDRADLVELLKAGIDANACRAWLQTNAPGLVADLDVAERSAKSEEEG